MKITSQLRIHTPCNQHLQSRETRTEPMHCEAIDPGNYDVMKSLHRYISLVMFCI